jgi:hypothetical protein
MFVGNISEYHDNSVTLSFSPFCILWQVSSVRLQPGINSGEPVMRTSLWGVVLLVAAYNLVQTHASAQERRLLVVSPKVGAVIDSTARRTYNLFPGMKNFYSASFYQTPDSSIYLLFKRRSGTTVLPDSTRMSSFFTLNQVAEWIEHFDEIAKGTHQLGSSQPPIFYEDGTRFRPPTPQPKKEVTTVGKRTTDNLPLAPNTGGLARPLFNAVHLDFAFGLAFNDLSELGPLGAGTDNTGIPFTLYVEVPIYDDPGISLMGGWGASVTQHGLSSFAVFVIARPFPAHSLTPFFGIGFGQSSYSSSGTIIVTAQQSYPALALGLNLVPNFADVVFTLPIAAKLETTFENKSYSVSIAGPQISLMISL